MRYTAAKSRPTYPFDADLEFCDGGAVTASAAALVDAVARVVDLGKGYFAGDMVIDVASIAVDGGDESYRICLELSDAVGFSAGTEFDKCSIILGDSSLTNGDVDSVVGRYIMPFNNRAENGTLYRYARLYTTHAGSTSSINFTAFAAPHQ